MTLTNCENKHEAEFKPRNTQNTQNEDRVESNQKEHKDHKEGIWILLCSLRSLSLIRRPPLRCLLFNLGFVKIRVIRVKTPIHVRVSCVLCLLCLSWFNPSVQFPAQNA